MTFMPDQRGGGAPPLHWLRPAALAFMLLVIASLVGCQPQNPPGPTVIPTDAPTLLPTPTQTAPVTPTPPAPLPTPRLMVTSTALVTPAPVLFVGQPTPTASPICFEAKSGDTLYSLILRAPYGNPSMLPAVRAANGLCPTCSNVEIGRTYCIPRPTATPTAPGYEVTLSARSTAISGLPTRVRLIVQYKITERDNGVIALQLNTGATLRELCELNEDKLNCQGCQLDEPIGKQGCRVPIPPPGTNINVYGPEPTVTITPTLTGLETTTPTPVFGMPRPVSPVDKAAVSGPALLTWLPVGVLQPDEFYLLLWQDMTSGAPVQQIRTEATSYRIPSDSEPANGASHEIRWLVGVAREAADGSYVLISPMSAIQSFTWQGR